MPAHVRPIGPRSWKHEEEEEEEEKILFEKTQGLEAHPGIYNGRHETLQKTSA